MQAVAVLICSVEIFARSIPSEAIGFFHTHISIILFFFIPRVHIFSYVRLLSKHCVELFRNRPRYIWLIILFCVPLSFTYIIAGGEELGLCFTRLFVRPPRKTSLPSPRQVAETPKGDKTYPLITQLSSVNSISTSCLKKENTYIFVWTTSRKTTNWSIKLWEIN